MYERISSDILWTMDCRLLQIGSADDCNTLQITNFTCDCDFDQTVNLWQFYQWWTSQVRVCSLHLNLSTCAYLRLKYWYSVLYLYLYLYLYLLLEYSDTSLQIFGTFFTPDAWISAAYAVVRHMSITLMYCVETAVGHSCYRMRKGHLTQAFEWYDFYKRPVTHILKGHVIIWRWIYQKRYKIHTYCNRILHGLTRALLKFHILTALGLYSHISEPINVTFSIWERIYGQISRLSVQ